MKIIRQPDEFKNEERKVCLAIGTFDGVHLGHQQVIRQTISDARQHEARSVAVTFDRHPASVLAPDRAPPLIYTLEQKLDTIAEQGMDTALLLEFTEAFSRVPAEKFIRDLSREFGPIHSICVGSRFSFGHRRRGNVALLQRLGNELGFTVHGLASVSLDGEVVSSTRIRDAIQRADFDAAGQMLGRAYCLRGTVVEGHHLGKELGFPTANLDTVGLALPGNGVYAAHVNFGGNEHRAVLNIGNRPTLDRPSSHPVVEIHMLDFSGDLYGRTLEVNFIEKIRREQKFSSLDALRRQISQDVEKARRLFN